MSPQNMSLWYIDYVELLALKNCKFREGLSLNSLICLKTDPQKEFSSHQSPPWGLTLVTGEGTRSQHHIRLGFATIYPFIYSSKALPSFLKITYSLLCGLYPPPLSLLRQD